MQVVYIPESKGANSDYRKTNHMYINNSRCKACQNEAENETGADQESKRYTLYSVVTQLTQPVI